jgi:glycosyltransferase involved in cell wall biosynthesis
VYFLFVGDGPEYGRYSAMIRDLGLQSRVTLTGLIGDPIGEGLYASSDIVCQVSRWGEAFGFTIAEAMASGRPVIGTCVGAIPELVRDGHSGFLVEPGDVNAMAERLLLLARSPELRVSMGAIGREICEREFDVVKQVALLIRMYRICKTERGPCLFAGLGSSKTSRTRSRYDGSQCWT